MESFVVHAQASIPWQRRYSVALLDGLRARGYKADCTATQATFSGINIVLGPNCFRPAVTALRRAGRGFITINRAFIGSVLGDEPDPYVAIGWNGYNNHAQFPFAYGAPLPYSRATDAFWKEVKPSRSRVGPVLILGEYETPPEFYRRAAQDCERLGMPWWFRPHPSSGVPSRRTRLCHYEYLGTACEESSLCLTHHSTAGCEALLRGLPVVPYDSESMCWPVCQPGPISGAVPQEVPDRRAWVEWLAWTQWTITEISRGDPWEWVLATDRESAPYAAQDSESVLSAGSADSGASAT